MTTTTTIASPAGRQLRQALNHLHVAAQDYAEGSPEWRAIDNAIAYVETAAEVVTGKRPG